MRIESMLPKAGKPTWSLLGELLEVLDRRSQIHAMRRRSHKLTGHPQAHRPPHYTLTTASTSQTCLGGRFRLLMLQGLQTPFVAGHALASRPVSSPA